MFDEDDTCASCGLLLGDEEWESSVYSPGRRFLLCFPCGREEEEEIDRQGTNELPERLHRYERTFA